MACAGRFSFLSTGATYFTHKTCHTSMYHVYIRTGPPPRRPSRGTVRQALSGRFHFRTLRTQAATRMHTSSTVPIATPAMMPAMVLSARSTS